MIIKCLFRRYERWNPVHPTVGAFWGMGFGIGCGVGWGPGFGPEVIGYVGSGCGVGFSVGFTMAGIGIGLPTNYFFQLPYNAVMATKSAVEYGRASGFLSLKSMPAGSWTLVAPHVSIFHAEASRRLSKLKQQNFLKPRANLFVPLKSESAWKSLQTFSGRIFQPRHGPGD